MIDENDRYFKTLRREYKAEPMHQAELHEDPTEQFRLWFTEAVKRRVIEPNAMSLATVGDEGKPSCRTVLLKQFTDDAFIFFSNYNSKKGGQLAENSNASLNFWWREMARQVIIEGVVSKIPEKNSEEYFKTRDRKSQLSAWASQQSTALAERSILKDAYAAAEAKFKGHEVIRPPHWGGYQLIPQYIEFWQGRPCRLHDRIAYQRQANGSWKLVRLAP